MILLYFSISEYFGAIFMGEGVYRLGVFIREGRWIKFQQQYRVFS